MVHMCMHMHVHMHMCPLSSSHFELIIADMHVRMRMCTRSCMCLCMCKSVLLIDFVLSLADLIALVLGRHDTAPSSDLSEAIVKRHLMLLVFYTRAVLEPYEIRTRVMRSA